MMDFEILLDISFLRRNGESDCAEPGSTGISHAGATTANVAEHMIISVNLKLVGLLAG